jgi:tetratricopeptide (TPR) repeat protein
MFPSKIRVSLVVVLAGTLMILAACSKPLSEVEKYRRQGNELLRKRDFDGAIAEYTKAIELDPSDEASYLARAGAKRDMGDWEGAIAEITTLIERNPTNAEAYIVRGIMRTVKRDEEGRMSDLDGAIADFEKALDIDPMNKTAQYHFRTWTEHKRQFSVLYGRE